MKFYRDIIYFFLTYWCHMRRKNATEITKSTEMYLYRIFQADVLINFFIPLR